MAEASPVRSAVVADRANNHDNFGDIRFVDGHVKGYTGPAWLTGNNGGSILSDFR